MRSPALFIVYLSNLWQRKLFLQSIANMYQPLGVKNWRVLVVHSERIYHRQDSTIQRQPALRSSAACSRTGSSIVMVAQVWILLIQLCWTQSNIPVWYLTLAHLTVWDHSISHIAVMHPVVWCRHIHSHWCWCLLSCRHSSWLTIIHLIHTGYETTLQCCWLLVILDLVKLRKKTNSFSCYEVYRSGLFYRRSQRIYCKEKLLQRKENQINMSRNTEAKQYSCVLQFKNFIEKNPFTPNNVTK